MKRMTAFFLAVVLILSLCSCAQTPPDDKSFLTNLKKGLESRLAAGLKAPDAAGSAAYKAQTTALIRKETDAIGDISGYTFRDKHLEELAHRYTDALDAQLEGISSYGSDDARYSVLFQQRGYFERCKIIAELARDYSFSLSDKWSSAFGEYLEDGSKAAADEAVFLALENMIGKEIILAAKDPVNYETTVTNPTGSTLKDITLYVYLYDADDQQVGWSLTTLETWSPGETAKACFFLSEDFDHARMSVGYYSGSIYVDHITEKRDITVLPFDPGVEIVLVNPLPAEFTSKHWYRRNTCTVTDFSCAFSCSDGERSTFTISIGGTKTDDRQGPDNASYCCVNYRLTNADKSVVYTSGGFYTADLTVGQSFVDCIAYLSDLTPGTYYLELSAPDF